MLVRAKAKANKKHPQTLADVTPCSLLHSAPHHYGPHYSPSSSSELPHFDFPLQTAFPPGASDLAASVGAGAVAGGGGTTLAPGVPSPTFTGCGVPSEPRRRFVASPGELRTTSPRLRDLFRRSSPWLRLLLRRWRWRRRRRLWLRLRLWLPSLWLRLLL